MELVRLLTEQLGVSPDQAQGGAGLLFKLAKEGIPSREPFPRCSADAAENRES